MLPEVIGRAVNLGEELRPRRVCGSPAAIANAAYHAAGVRVRDLPITPDKLIL